MGRIGEVVALYRETVRLAWMRHEFRERSSTRKILHFLVLYGSFFGVMIAVGLILQLTGYTTIASGFWYFGIGFTLFMAAVDIAWESVTLVLERRDTPAQPDPEASAQRELAPDLHVRRDTWVGFFVTMIALLVLIGVYQLILYLG